MMNIVVYGCDNSGKTSLANHIAEKFKLQYVRSKGGPNMSTQEVLQYLDKNLDEGNKVFDRFSIIEEYTNGLILRGKDRFREEFIDELSFMERVDLFIYACPSMEEVKKFGDREQMDGIIENIDKLREMYRVFTINDVITPNRRLIIFDWTKDKDYAKIDQALEYFFENAERKLELMMEIE